MKINKLSIKDTLNKTEAALAEETTISPVLRSLVTLLITIVTLLADKLLLSSKNSNKPPSQDPNRKKTKNRKPSNNKPGGQSGHTGTTLEQTAEPDRVIELTIDRRTIPAKKYKSAGFEVRQVIDLEITSVVTEYRAEILVDPQGQRYVAEFPKDVTRPIQYGNSVRAHAVYMSQFQLIPYDRLSNYFMHEMLMPISAGSLVNFNQEAYKLLEKFDLLVKQKLQQSKFINADETGTNVNGKHMWLHNASNDLWTYLYPHEKRGTEAMNEIGILPNFTGVLIHDHWKPYYSYQQCTHALCNAHHIRELEWVVDNRNQNWAKNMQNLLLEANTIVNQSDQKCLDNVSIEFYQNRYREILTAGEQEILTNTPNNKTNKGSVKQKGKIKQSKELNLLKRLQNYEKDTLLFMKLSFVPFTNNQGENDIRMSKVQQKISGCFKSLLGAKMFCRIRSYLLSAQKHKVDPSIALKLLFEGKMPPEFGFG